MQKIVVCVPLYIEGLFSNAIPRECQRSQSILSCVAVYCFYSMLLYKRLTSLSQDTLCRDCLHEQLFLLNLRLNDTILKTRIECVVIWELQLIGVQPGQVYSLKGLQASYQASAQVRLKAARGMPCYLSILS